MFPFYLKVIVHITSSKNAGREETSSLCSNPPSVHPMACCVFQVPKLAIFISPVAGTNLTILKLQFCVVDIEITVENLVIKKGNLIYK